MNRQSLVDRILETENLTSNLDDSDADVLLKWGIAQVDELIKNVGTNQAADDRINQLMGVMREVNAWAGDPVSATPNAIINLKTQYLQLLGSREKVNEDDAHEMIRRLSKMAPHDSLMSILTWLNE